MEMKRNITIQSLFTKFLVWFCSLSIVTLCVFVGIFSVLCSAGIVLPAYYGENMLERNRTEIETAETVTPEMIPAECQYGLFDTDGTYLSGNIEEKKQTAVWEAYEQGKTIAGRMGNLKYFQRGEEICIAVYYLKPIFADQNLRKWIPDVQGTLIFLCIICFLGESVLLVRRFSRTIRMELEKVKQVTEKVRQENLEFEKPVTRIREVDEVMNSLVQLRDALEVSLKKQWTLEDERRQQMRALIHDIKTPLTVIRGNAQLIGESESEEESRECQGYILQEADRIEEYIRTLQEMLKSEDTSFYHREEVDLQLLTKEFTERATMLAAGKHQKLDITVSCTADYILCDGQFLLRAWENLLANAIEYTPPERVIMISISQENQELCFCIEDEGPGFTDEDLRHGIEQFYQGDKSRNAKNHYGMGLFMVQSFANHMGGRMVMENSSRTNGARVCLYVGEMH